MGEAVESQPPRCQEQNFHGWWETELPDGNIGACWLNNSRVWTPGSCPVGRESYRESSKTCQLPRGTDAGDGLEALPAPGPSQTKPHGPERGRKRSLRVCVGTLPPALTPLVSQHSPGEAPARSISTTGMVLGGWAPELAAMTLLQGMKPEK